MIEFLNEATGSNACLVNAVRHLRASLRSPACAWNAGQREAAENAVRDSERYLNIKPLPQPQQAERRSQ